MHLNGRGGDELNPCHAISAALPLAIKAAAASDASFHVDPGRPSINRAASALCPPLLALALIKSLLSKHLGNDALVDERHVISSLGWK